MDAHDDARKAKKLLLLIERECMDTTEAAQLWKEWEELLWAIEELCMEHDVAHQEHADAQQRIVLLEGEL